MSDLVFITRVVLKNYKSIAACSVRLGPLTFLVGPNGAGKSNFVEALRFLKESLRTSLDQALQERGGIGEVRRRTLGRHGRPTHFGMRLEVQLPDGVSGWYGFQVGARSKSSFAIQHEECHLFGPKALDKSFFLVKSGKVVEANPKVALPSVSDRLYLVVAASLPEFRGLYDAFSRMGFYNLNPDEIRELQNPDPGEVLKRDGGNLASVLRVMEKNRPDARKQVIEFLSKVVPGVKSVATKALGKKETLEFRQTMGERYSWRFPAESMSDGTLRALGVLTALYQGQNGEGRRVPVVGIEEPEMAVHPGAAGILRDALISASASTQVIVTSHSPDLLDDKSVKDDWILSVVNLNGETKIAPIEEADRSAIRDRLYTPGELMRQGQLSPDMSKVEATPQSQLGLFVEMEQ
ncbi:MAG: AAA family ATPase [Deltaproteobacteria bacterium]|nr:AAA family ATPase [Deltaproteobacteria bacterium]